MIPTSFSRLRLLNLREVRMHWVRALATVSVVAVSTALLVAVLGIAGSITGSIDRLAASIGGDADLEVSGVTDAGFDESVLDAVSAVPGVVAAVPILRTQVTANSHRTLLLGVDGTAAQLHSDLQDVIQQQLSAAEPVTGPNPVIAGHGLSITSGDQFQVGATTVTAAVVVDGPVARRLNLGYFVIAPMALAQGIADRPGRLDSVLLKAAPGADTDAVRAAVTGAVAGRAVVATPALRAAQASSSVAILLAVTLLAASASLVVAALLSYNALSIAVAQRRPIISTLRALGARPRMLAADLVTEAALLGFLGGVIGSASGIVVGRSALSGVPSTLVNSLEARMEWVLAPYVVPVAIAAAVGASVAAAALAARQVQAVTPVEALSPLGALSSAIGSRGSRFAAGLAAAVLLVATVAIVITDFGGFAMVSMALAIVGGLLLCFAFSPVVIAAVAFVARWFGAAGVVGAANVTRAPRRMWVAMMTVVTAVVTTVGVTGSAGNAVDSTLDSYSSVLDADIWVRSTPATEYPTSPLLPDGIVATVQAVPGVAKVVGGQMAFVSLGDTKVLMSGVASGAVRGMSAGLSATELDALLAGRGITLTRGLGRQLGVGVGDQISIQTPTGERTVRVLGVVPYFSGLTGLAAIGLGPMQEWFQRPGLTELQITVDAEADSRAVQAGIRDAVPSDVYVYSGQEAVAGISAALDQVVAVISIVGWIVVIVCAATLLNTLMLSVLNRRREIGVLRAIGASRGFTIRTILAEAAGIGIVGGVLGLLYGEVIQYLLSIALSGALSIDVRYGLSPMVPAVGIAALVICLMGAIPPAVRAARLNIVRAVGAE